MRKILLIIVSILILTAMIETAEAKNITLAILDYEAEDLIVESGNLTLTFYNSTNNNKSDVSILKLNYIPEYDLTVMKISSEEVTYDYNFENNTKTYVFNCTNNSNFYLIKINYSSIKVPKSPMEYYQEMLLKKNETIRQLQANLTNTTNNASNYNVSLKNAMDRLAILENYKSQTEDIVSRYDSSESENRNLTVEVSAKQAKIGVLEEEKDLLQATIDSFGPFSVTYSKDGSDVFYFNGAWFLMGGLLFVGLFFFFTSKKTANIRNKSKDAAAARLHRKEVEIPDVYDIRSERPSIERDMLRQIQKEEPPQRKEEPPQKTESPPQRRVRHEEISKNVDEIINNKKVDNILNKKW